MCNPNSTALAYRRQRAAALLNPHLLDSTGTAKSVSPYGAVGYSPTTHSRKSDASHDDVPSDAASKYAGFSAPQGIQSTWGMDDTGKVFNFPATLSLLHYGFPKCSDTMLEKKSTTGRRRRKPQKPGKTAKQNDRHFVVHSYHDHGKDEDEDVDLDSTAGSRRRGGVTVSFPSKLHSVLDQVEQDGLAHVVSWQPHGRCFVIHKPKEFTEHIMPHYFRQSKITSFQRQLNLYGFNRITRGNDAGGYYHELFLRGKEFLCKRMVRTKVKGTRFKAASSPDQEPDFYTMPPVTVTPPTSDCDSTGTGTAPGNSYEYSSTRTESVPHEDSCQHSPIGNPERYQQFPSPRRHVAAERSQVAERSPLPYPITRISADGAPMMSYSFDSYDSPKTTAINPEGVSTQGHGILDQAVDELFLACQGGVPPTEVNDDSVLDFVNVWDPTSLGPDGALENDTQLGNLLDRLLWDEI